MEKNCNNDGDFYPEMKTKKTTGSENTGYNHPIVKEIDAKETMPKGQMFQTAPSKRQITQSMVTQFFSLSFILDEKLKK